MRKLIMLVALLLIATAILGPGLTGRLAERIVVDNNQAFAASLPDWLLLVEQRFERGWFSSRSRFRLVVTDPERMAMAARLLGASDFADEPAIIVDSVIAHGPLVGFLTPALARVESLLLTDAENGGLRTLPLILTSTFGLTGNSRFDWLLGEGLIGSGQSGIRWRSVALTQRVRNTLNESTITIDVPDLVFHADGETTGFEGLRVAALLTREGGLVQADGEYSVAQLVPVSAAPMAVNGTLLITGLSERALAMLREPAREWLRTDPQDRATVVDRYLPALLALLGDDLALAWTQGLHSDAGALDIDLKVDFPPASTIAGAADARAALQQIAGRMGTQIELRMTTSFAQQLADSNPQLQGQLTMLQGMGILAPDETGDNLTMQVDYAGGSLTVNGLPVAVPAAAP